MYTDDDPSLIISNNFLKLYGNRTLDYIRRTCRLDSVFGHEDLRGAGHISQCCCGCGRGAHWWLADELFWRHGYNRLQYLQFHCSPSRSDSAHRFDPNVAESMM